jgi:hypothetical protein
MGALVGRRRIIHYPLFQLSPGLHLLLKSLR